MSELIYSDLWREKDNDRKDLTYSPLSKNLKDVVCFPKSDLALLDKVLESYINE